MLDLRTKCSECAGAASCYQRLTADPAASATQLPPCWPRGWFSLWVLVLERISGAYRARISSSLGGRKMRRPGSSLAFSPPGLGSSSLTSSTSPPLFALSSHSHSSQMDWAGGEWPGLGPFLFHFLSIASPKVFHTKVISFKSQPSLEWISWVKWPSLGYHHQTTPWSGAEPGLTKCCCPFSLMHRKAPARL